MSRKADWKKPSKEVLIAKAAPASKGSIIRRGNGFYFQEYIYPHAPTTKQIPEREVADYCRQYDMKLGSWINE